MMFVGSHIFLLLVTTVSNFMKYMYISRLAPLFKPTWFLVDRYSKTKQTKHCHKKINIIENLLPTNVLLEKMSGILMGIEPMKNLSKGKTVHCTYYKYIFDQISKLFSSLKMFRHWGCLRWQTSKYITFRHFVPCMYGCTQQE